MKKILLILVIVAIFVAAVLWFTITSTKRQNNTVQQNYQSQNQNQSVSNDTVTDFVEGLKNSKEVVGVVGTVRTPNDGNVVFIQVDADVINIDELKNVDFTKKSNELPMKKQSFVVAVDDTTTLKKVDKKESIKSGDMVRVVSAKSVNDVQEFTAVEIEVVATR